MFGPSKANEGLRSEMKVLFITSTFSLKGDDSLVPWMRNLVVGLKSKGVDLEVLAPAIKGSPSHKISDVQVHRFRYAPAPLEILTQDEGAVSKIRKNPFLALLSIPYMVFGTIAAVRRSVGSKYDVIHVNWPFPLGLIGLVAKWVSRGKLVFTFYGAEFALINKIPFGKLIMSFILKRADKVIAISEYTKKKVQQIAKVRIAVIPFTSGIQILTRKSEIRSKVTKDKRVLFVGRLIERKGVAYLIDAVPEVIKSVGAKVDIVGDGPLLDQLKDQVRRKKLTGVVTIHGRVSEAKLKELYLISDVFVLPAITDRWGDTEGLGVVLLEAMSIGKPVVATNVGGITDIVKHNKTGYLVSEKNSLALAGVLVKVLGDNKLARRLGASGQRFVKESFSWEMIIEKTLNIYQ